MLRKVLILSLIVSPLLAEEAIDRKRLMEAVEQLTTQHELLADEIDNIKKLLGVYPELDGLDPLEPSKKMNERVRIRIEDGIKSYRTADYERAKEDFQRAWEEAPDRATTNYNLGLAYHKMGNLPLAKKMLKSALEIDPKLKDAGKIRNYLEGKATEESNDGLSEEEKIKQTAMINLKKEADSYLYSNSLSLPKRRSETVKVLREMVQKAQGSNKLKEKYYLDVADTYALFELFDDALDVLEEYQVSMKDKVLPDGFHTKRLSIEEKQQALTHLLDSYLGNKVDSGLHRKFKRNSEELEIFATQIHEFVKELNQDDADFTKISKRLAEYRWGGKPNRHVIVANRFEELLYTSLDGTLPIDRYQDTEGKKFLQHITRLADRMELKQVEFKEVELNVGNKKVPYLILYTYIPKHEAFIIVRVPKENFS